MEKVRLGVIGMGIRGTWLTRDTILANDKALVVALCDKYMDRCEEAAKIVTDAGQPAPFVTTDYHELLAREDVDAVLISASWEAHFPIAIDALKAGKTTALEVGGAFSVEDCWRLVRTWEETKTPFMFMENCCYGRREMMVKNLAKQGRFGRIVHCSGAYQHDLRQEMVLGEDRDHYRLRNYLCRDAENYPTHELGPIAQILGINRGNRMLSLVSMSSLSAGLHEYINENHPERETLKDAHFNQGDVITTIIKCANGETIRMMLCTTLPNFYSRDFNIHGTKALYMENPDCLFFDGDEVPGSVEFNRKEQMRNADRYAEEFDHPLWKDFLASGIKGGHGGMDYLVFDEFFTCILENRPFPIDVYDAASWMVITALSEQSIACGSMPMPIPDFTNGAWQWRENNVL